VDSLETGTCDVPWVDGLVSLEFESASCLLFGVNDDTVRPFKNETTILRLRSYFFLMLS